MAAVLRATTSLLLLGLLSALGACTGPTEIPSDGLRKSSAMVEALPRAPSCDREVHHVQFGVNGAAVARRAPGSS